MSNILGYFGDELPPQEGGVPAWGEEDEDKYPPPPTAVEVAQPAPVKTGQLDFTQWQMRGNGCYFPSGPTVPTLPAGNYWPEIHPDYGPYLQLREIINDDIVTVPDSASAKVLAAMAKFWASRERYQRFGLLFKRGILLFGPPGSGKSVTVRQLSSQIITLGGIVVHCSAPQILAHLLRSVRSVEPERPIIVIYEDIDEIIRRFTESDLLALLDGETQIANIVHIATTNYPERLGARIANRPSRFDERIEIGMPTREQRRCYLTHIAPDSPDIEKWVADTSDLSIAHLRELVAAVYCLDADYADTLDRLKEMCEAPKDPDGFAEKKRQMGFDPGRSPR